MSEVLEGKPQLPPGFCFICELSNDVRYIDTYRDFEGIVKEKLDGRKYVCEECVGEFAQKIGFIHQSSAEEYLRQIGELTDKVKELESAFEQYEQLSEIVSGVGGRIVIEVGPKKQPPARKPAAPKAA